VANVTRVAVIGSTGQVGRAVLREMETNSVRAVGLRRDAKRPDYRLDLLDIQTVRRSITAVMPTHIVLAAAVTDVAECERYPLETARANVLGTTAVIDAALSIRARVLFISSDYVFDGNAGPYDEEATPRPINEYGRQKRAVEKYLVERDAGLVVRTCQVFGDDVRRANYVLRVADQARRGIPIRAAVDLMGTPTYVDDLAGAIVALLLGSGHGYWHIAGPEYLSRYELALKVAAAACADVSLVDAVPFAAIDDGVPRPMRSGLTSLRGHHPAVRSLDAALSEMHLCDDPVGVGRRPNSE
jgi:dTDP-4-dehydrorhamnose reductase